MARPRQRDRSHPAAAPRKMAEEYYPVVIAMAMADSFAAVAAVETLPRRHLDHIVVEVGHIAQAGYSFQAADIRISSVVHPDAANRVYLKTVRNGKNCHVVPVEGASVVAEPTSDFHCHWQPTLAALADILAAVKDMAVDRIVPFDQLEDSSADRENSETSQAHHHHSEK